MLPDALAVLRVPPRIARRARALWRGGNGRLAYAVACKLSDPWRRRGLLQFAMAELYQIELSQWKRASRVPASWVIRRATGDDAPALEQLYGSARRVQPRLQRGDACFLTMVQGQLGAAVWSTIRPSRYREDWDELRCTVVTSSSAAWIYDGVGVKMGAWGALMARLPDLLEPLGVRQAYALTDLRNQRSVDAHRSLGYQRAGLLVRIGWPRCGLSLFKPPAERCRRLPHQVGEIRLCPHLD